MATWQSVSPLRMLGAVVIITHPTLLGIVTGSTLVTFIIPTVGDDAHIVPFCVPSAVVIVTHPIPLGIVTLTKSVR